MRYDKITIASSIVALTFLLGACGSNSSSTTTPSSSTTVSGFLVDANISGADYTCGGESNVTTSSGAYTCPAGSTIKVSVGSMYLGEKKLPTVDNVIYPQDLLGLSRDNFTDANLTKFARFVQSLDDGSVAGILTLNQATKAKFTTTQSLGDLNDTEVSTLLSNKSIPYVDETTAINHLKEAMGVALEASFNPSSEPYYKYQWHLNSSTNYEAQNTAFGAAFGNMNALYTSIVPAADINITEAWKLSRGEGVRVAVYDDGVDVNHEDIKENLILAWNIDTNSSDVSNTSSDGNHSLHGNHCAGFITASLNGVGTVGVAPSAQLIAIKQTQTDDAKTILAFEYAKDHGAKVINCSWGTLNVSESVVAELKSLYDANITVVFASGNDHLSLDEAICENSNVPCFRNDESEVEWVISVGSSSEYNDLSPFSTYGASVDVIAPGGDASNSIGMLCTDDTGEQGSKDNYGVVDNNYSFGNGTSYSAPVVSGVVALMYDVYPNITPKQVRDILISTTDKIGTTTPSKAIPEYDTYGILPANYELNATSGLSFDVRRAYGKINAGRAVAAAKALNN
jgi:subtilisin family serine protease